MPRYTVGDKYLFARTRYKHMSEDMHQLLPTTPWDITGRSHFHLIDHIDVKVLETIEHHKVSSGWDALDRKDGDGFVFKEVGTDQLWRNQYPQYTMEQLSDRANWLVKRALPETLVPDSQLYLYVEQYEDARIILEELRRGIKQLADNVEPEAVERHKELASYGLMLEKAIHDKGFKVSFVDENISLDPNKPFYWEVCKISPLEVPV